MMSSEEILETVQRLLAGERLPALAKSTLQEWLAHSDPEVRGAAYLLIRERDLALHTEPSLTREDIVEIVLAFFGRAIHEETGGDWAFSGYEAAWDFAAWFTTIADDSSVPRALVVDIANWLGRLYLTSDAEARTTLINGALEHIFERRHLRKLFRGWESSVELAHAKRRSAIWSDAGGDSPIVGRRHPRRPPKKGPGRQ